MSNDVLPSFPSTDPDLVSGVVGAAHTDLDAVVDLVTTHPHLARATLDWGFGDWESALGAASHMGRRDIAEFPLNAPKSSLASTPLASSRATTSAIVMSLLRQLAPL